MARSEARREWPGIDWRAWLALAWACGVGWLYLRMIWDARGAAILAAARRLLGL
jgi:hypothetical protein